MGAPSSVLRPRATTSQMQGEIFKYPMRIDVDLNLTQQWRSSFNDGVDGWRPALGDDLHVHHVASCISMTGASALVAQLAGGDGA